MIEMRQWAYEIVYGTMEQKQHSDRLFHKIVGENHHFPAREKRFLKRLSYGTIERCVELDAILEQFSKLPVKKLTSPVRTVLRIALYEIRYMDQIPEAVSCHEAVELLKRKEGKQHTGYVNGVLRSILREQSGIVLREKWQQLSLPQNLYDYLCSRYGKKTAAKIGEAFLESHQEITLHIDTSKVSIEEYEKLLTEEGIVWKKASYMPEALIVSGIEDVTTLPGYGKGCFFVQDESSMLPVACAGVRPGNEVVDVCSAPGGKAMHALLCLAGQGTLSARDVSAAKVQRIEENFRRMGYANGFCKVWDAAVPDTDWSCRADVVLADVPCSGIGIIGRKPEIKYRAMETSAQLIPLQRKIAEAAVTMLKPGGTLIYSTCTIHAGENEENVQWMLQHLDLEPVSLNPCLPEILQNKMTACGMLQILPGIHNSDGFFVAKFRKTFCP